MEAKLCAWPAPGCSPSDQPVGGRPWVGATRASYHEKLACSSRTAAPCVRTTGWNLDEGEAGGVGSRQGGPGGERRSPGPGRPRLGRASLSLCS